MRLHVKVLVITGTLLTAGLGAAAPAAATALPSCSVSWTGNAGDGLWGTASNWSTHKVPGPASDVCILTLATVGGMYTQAPSATTNMTAGSLSATSVSVRSGSALQGNGTVATSITDNGNVASQGSLMVTGSYSQTASAALTEQFGSTLEQHPGDKAMSRLIPGQKNVWTASTTR